MADNVLKRIIQLVLDKGAALRAQKDVEDTTGKMDKAFKDLATKIAGYLGVAFVLKKIVDFGTESVKQAMESQVAWSDLKTTIDNTGESFDEMESKLRATADAFQDATGKDDDKFASSLSRLITLTGDTSASLNNMGLVANVAAKFFNGELEPATTLVAKAMNGNTAALQKMGIHAENAQQALEILASRSLGAAERASHTFAGKLEALHEEWNDVLKDFGFAVIGAEGTSDAFEILRAAVKTLGEWVNTNKDQIRLWVTDGVKFAIDATDVLVRAVKLLNDVFFTLIDGGLAGIVQGFSLYAIGMSRAAEAAIALRIATGQSVSPAQMAEAVRLRQQADAYIEWANALSTARKEHQKAAKDDLFKPLFDSSQFSGPSKSVPLPGENNKPKLGKNATSTASEDVKKAVKEFEDATKAADLMKKVLGDDFDSVGAEISRTSKLLEVLAANGVDPTTTKFGNLTARLSFLTKEAKPLQDVAKDLAKSLGTDVAVAAVTMGTGLESATTKLELLKAKQSDYLGSLKALAAQHLTNTDLYRQYAEQYRILTSQIEDETKVQLITDANKALADSLKSDLAVGMLTGASATDQLRIQQAAALEGFTKLVRGGVDPASEAVQKFATDYVNLTVAIGQSTEINDTATAFRDLGDAIRGGVFEQSIGAINSLDMLKKKQDALKKAMMTPSIMKDAAALRDLAAQYRDVTDAIEEQTFAMELQSAVADVLAEAMGAALVGGLHEAAAKKAKQNAIEAAEMLVRAGVFALFGDVGHAAAALHSAAAYGVVAAAWAGLAAGSSGGSSAPSTPAFSGSSSSPAGETLTQSRSATNRSTSNATQPSPEVSIYLVGPGFDAVNPRVQAVVWGAQQQAKERFGENARIRIRTNEG